MDIYVAVVQFFQQGGVFMYPISLVLVVGLAIAIERSIYLLRLHKSDGELWLKLQPLVDSGRFSEMSGVIAESKSSMSAALSSSLRYRRNGARKEELESIIEEGLLEIVPRMERRTHYLATFANIATLMGLLGTIIGLIQAFTAISNVDAAQKADLLSSSISVAMNTTAYGLMVAIPLLLVYSVLQTKTNAMIETAEAMSLKFINRLSMRPELGATQ